MEGNEIHQWVANYNWDDGFDPIWPIVENKETEFATALMIYWRLEGPWLEAGSEQARHLHDAVEERLLSGYYRMGTMRYHPVAENQLSKAQVYKLKKAGIPMELIEPEYPLRDS